MAFQSMLLLPDEILVLIFSHLPLQDIKSLRLVCHDFYSCSSQFLLWCLHISSAENNLHFYKNITSDDLFRKGISSIVYNTRLNTPSVGDGDKLGPDDRHEELQDSAPDAFDQCYSVYDLLCYGIPRLPMLREINITDRMLKPSPNQHPTNIPIISTESNERRIRNGELSLFILLRALSIVHCKPQTFRISLQSFIAGFPTTRPQPTIPNENGYGTGYGKPSSPTLFDRCLTTALPIFQDLRHLSIITQFLGHHTDIENYTSFIRNLCAFVSTASCCLQILEIAIQEVLPAGPRLDTILFSNSLFALTPNNFPFLTTLILKGVAMEGFALVAFLSRQSRLEELRLREIRLTRNSPGWTAIVDDLCLILGVQFEGGRRKGKEKAPMERIKLELENVFEPGESGKGSGVSIGSLELRRYFRGREDNPLRSCYENFVGCEVDV